MTIHVNRHPYDRLTALTEMLARANEERVRQAGYIAQFIATYDLERLCEGPHSVFDRQRLAASRDATADLIDRLRGRLDWPEMEPSSILTNGGDLG